MKTATSWSLLTRVMVVAMLAVSFGPAVSGRSAQAAELDGALTAAARLSQAVPVVTLSGRNDTSAALRDIAPAAPNPQAQNVEAWERSNHGLPGRGRLGTAAPLPGGIDPVLDSTLVGEPLIPAPTVNFEGVSNLDNVLPPDPNGDIGPNHYVQWVNLHFAVYDRTGAVLLGPVPGNTLWAGFGGPCEITNNGDPIVQYDHLADRWMMSQFAFPNFPNGPFYQCIAVSQTPDPTGAWHRYEFRISNNKLNDYPKFGVWPDAYYMAINQFLAPFFSWAGQGAVAFERDKMLLGLPAQMVYFDMFPVDPSLGGMLPSDLDGPVPPVGAPNIFMEADDDAFGFPTDQLQLWQFHVDWVMPASSTFTFNSALPTAAFDSNICGFNRSCIPQPGTNVGLDAISDRLMYRLQYRNFGTHETLVTNHTVDVDGTDRAGIRWYELRDLGAGWSIFQQGTFSPNSTDRWMASIAMNSLGDMAVVYSISNRTRIFPSILYAGRLATDPLGTLPQGEGGLIKGRGSQTSSFSRWGDYSMMAIDSTDGCTFWFTHEYVRTTGSANWRTRVGAFKYPSCP